MNRKIVLYPLFALLFLGTLWQLDETVLYWNARTTMGTVEAIEQRKKQVGNDFVYWFTTYATVTWDEDGLDRRFEITDDFYSLSPRRSRPSVQPYVGMKVAIVYVKSKPHLTRYSVVHHSYRLSWLPLLLGWLFAWMEWRGKIPDSWYKRRFARG